jgi:hypothetical protein
MDLTVIPKYFGNILDEIYISRKNGILQIKFTDCEGIQREISCEIYDNMFWSAALKSELPINCLPNDYNSTLDIEIDDIPIKSKLKLTKVE